MSSTTLQAFEFEGNQVRTVHEEDGNILFCGTDVARTLGYKDTVNALKQHCRGVAKHHPIQDSLGRMQMARFVTEGDLYRLIVSSKLPEARKFESCVFDEVIPSIRRTGVYAVPRQSSEDDLTVISRGLLAAQRQLTMKDDEITSLRRDNETQHQTIETQKPMARLGELFLGTDGTLTVTQAARHLHTLDRTMTRDMMFGLLRGAGYLERRSNAPTMKAVKPGYLRQKCGRKRDGTLGRPYAVFTPKGLNWFIDRFVIPQQQGSLMLKNVETA